MSANRSAELAPATAVAGDRLPASRARAPPRDQPPGACVVARQLGPLASPDEPAERLRETVLRRERHPRRQGALRPPDSVVYRVERAEELLGRRVTESPTELICALTLVAAPAPPSSPTSQLADGTLGRHAAPVPTDFVRPARAFGHQRDCARAPATRRTVLASMAKPIPGASLAPICGSSAASVGMPITRPDRSTSAPPGLPGLIAALVWMTDERVTPLPSGTLRRTAETMPSVTLERSPRGFPRASAMSPTSTCDESENVAGRGRAPAMRITARSFAASRALAVAGWLSHEAGVTTRRVALPTTCAFVTTSPRASKTTPEPRSCGVRICTTDGETARTTLTNSCCSEVASSADATGATGVTSSLGRLPPQPTTTVATPASATAIRCFVI